MARRASKNFPVLDKPPAPKHLTPSIVPPQREPLTGIGDNQKAYLKYLYYEDQIIAMGPAGTGKTYLPSILAMDLLLDRKIEKIVVTRPVVGAGGEELGYFPGDQNEKFGHWTVPVLDAFEKRAGKNRVRSYITNGQIELAPLSTMRGRTFDDAFVLLDEAQNTSWDLMKMFLTRIGKGTKVVVTGDLKQSDKGGNNGLHVMKYIIEKQNLPIPIVEFTTDDVVRSELCALWVKAIEEYEGK